MEANVAHLHTIEPKDIAVGDIITFAESDNPTLIFSDVTVTVATPDYVQVEHKDGRSDAFDPSNGYWRAFLVEKAKPKLPTHKGVRIVIWKADGREFERGQVAFHNGSDALSWETVDNYFYGHEDIEEWALLPDDYFDVLKPQN